MSDWKHPLTGEAFNSQEDLLESCVLSFYKVLKEKYAIVEDEQQLISLFNELAGEPEKLTGVVKLQAITSEIKITRRVNVRYTKKRGEDHPLVELAKTYPFVEKLFSMDVRERSGEVRRLLEESRVEDVDEAHFKVSELIQATRNVTSGKPTIEIIPLKKEREESDEHDGS